MDLLARREHAARELRQKLKLREYENEEIEACISRLQTQDLQSDERFAESFVRQRMNQGYGPVRIRHELRDRGVRDDLIEQQVPGDYEIWLEIAARQHAKRYSLPAADLKERAKQSRYLQNRGFDFDVIKRVLNKSL